MLRILVELVPPQAIAQHQHIGAPLQSSSGVKLRPNCGATPSAGKKFAVTAARVTRTGSPTPARLSSMYVWKPESCSNDLVEDIATTKSGSRSGPASRYQAHKPVRIVIGKRPQQKRVYGGKNGCSGPDPQSKSDHGGKRKSTITAQLAQSISHVLPEQLCECSGTVVTHSLFHLLHAAELRQRRAPCLRRGHARSNPLLRHHIDIRSHLCIELAFSPLLVEEIPRVLETCARVSSRVS